VELVILTGSVVSDDIGLGVVAVSRIRVMLEWSLQSRPAKPSSQKQTASVVHT